MAKKNDDADFIQALFQLGYDGYAVTDCGSDFEMTEEDFMEKYMSKKEYRIAYSAGRKKSKGEVLATVKKAADKGEFKAIEYMLSQVYGNKAAVEKSTSATTVERKTVKKKDGLEHLFNPLKISLDVREVNDPV